MHCRLLASALLLACAAAEEAPRLEVPVLAGGTASPIVTDLGYTVSLSEARVVVEDLEFATAGESHSGIIERSLELLVPRAHAHPGHYEGGEVTGELRGHFLLELLGPEQGVGMATLIAGDYTSASFTFGHATSADAVGDGLLGNTALLAGQVTRDGQGTGFSVVLRAEDERELSGVACEVTVAEANRPALRLELAAEGLDGETLFDGVAFADLPRNADGLVQIQPASSDASLEHAYDVVRRRFQTHDHFRWTAQPRR